MAAPTHRAILDLTLSEDEALLVRDALIEYVVALRQHRAARGEDASERLVRNLELGEGLLAQLKEWCGQPHPRRV